MKIKMLETFQGVGVYATLAHEGLRVSMLEKGETYDADTDLAEYLIASRKAEAVESMAHPFVPEPPVPGNPDEPSVMPVQPNAEASEPTRGRKRSRP